MASFCLNPDLHCNTARAVEIIDVTEVPPSSSSTATTIDLPLPPSSQIHSSSTSLLDSRLHSDLSAQHHHPTPIDPTLVLLPPPIFSSVSQLPIEHYRRLDQASSIYLAPPPPSVWLGYVLIQRDTILESFSNDGHFSMDPVFALL
ncbi:unnamed protein product [Rotaria sp. Silwood2]|nr:unnamed protein product [Rotaria sp. Silwood2]CAF3378549.1 unnamed protein product [Rotaria sp. Silwood2]CAF4416658.1 unnamed protein product [Rotaria sp. Silwood2]